MPSALISLLRRVDALHPVRWPSIIASRFDSTSQTQMAAIVIVSIISTLLLCIITYTIVCVLRTYLASKATITTLKNSTDEKPVDTEKGDSSRKPSAVNWARKDSNVLWSMYLDNDDLAAQFPERRWSRMFSIGSASTVDTNKCPLDRSSMESVRLPDLLTRVTTGGEIKSHGKICSVVMEEATIDSRVERGKLRVFPG